jgi:hypothetical protein
LNDASPVLQQEAPAAVERNAKVGPVDLLFNGDLVP